MALILPEEIIESLPYLIVTSKKNCYRSNNGWIYADFCKLLFEVFFPTADVRTQLFKVTKYCSALNQGEHCKGLFQLSVTNSKANKIKQVGGKYIKSKENSKMHGFGIQNIRDIVLKHQGTLDISYTQAEFLVMSIIKVE